ncbi:MAG TPA: hypothetical protein GX700_03765 [Paracoccus sp.]|nr:hypothetical protein [Paracoccus sp. (in: a-proteobacteria)]
MPPDLRFLKLLVTTLAGVMILGLVTIVALLVIRLTAAPAPLALPEGILLPEGSTPKAVTLATQAVIVVSETEILFFNRTTGDLERRYPLD